MGVTDFDAYIRWYRKHNTGLFSPPQIARGTVDARRAFKRQDSTGETVGTRHPRTLAAALTGKRQLNQQITDWSAGVAEQGKWHLAELASEYPWLPSWVWRAVTAQSERIRASQ